MGGRYHRMSVIPVTSLALLLCFQSCVHKYGVRQQSLMVAPVLHSSSGNQTWQWKIPYEWGVNRKITCKWSVFHYHAWLPEGTQLYWLAFLWSTSLIVSCCDGYPPRDCWACLLRDVRYVWLQPRGHQEFRLVWKKGTPNPLLYHSLRMFIRICSIIAARKQRQIAAQ